MPEKAFNLLDEPWIVTLRPDGKMVEVSLLDVFRDSHLYRGLAGELPTQDVALLRLLLAILYGVFTRYAPDGSFLPLCTEAEPAPSQEDAKRRWRELWRMGVFPIPVIERYLRRYQERFYLFHPHTPFYQVACNPTVTCTDGTRINPSAKEVGYFIGDLAEAGNKTRLFAARRQKGGLLYAEAARWLVHLLSFDVAPGGRPASTGVTVKGYGLPWPSRLGLVWASGENLFQTLMLNLQLSVMEGNGDLDIAWEHESKCDGETLLKTEVVFPRHLAGLYSTQFRRVQLERDHTEKRVTRCIIWSGLSVEDTNASLENMTLWKNREISKDVLQTVPRRHDPSRQVWRDLSALLPSVDSSDQAPGIVKWINEVQYKQTLNMPMVQLNTAGSEYSKNTSLSNVFSDSLRVNRALLSELGKAWVTNINQEVAVTDLLVKQVRNLARSLAIAEGNTEPRSYQQQADAAAQQAYFLLDEPFRRWLETINPETDEMANAMNTWWNTAQLIIRDYGKTLVAQVGVKAYVGHKLKLYKNDEERLYVAPKAYQTFVQHTSNREALKGKEGRDRK